MQELYWAHGQQSVRKEFLEIIIINIFYNYAKRKEEKGPQDGNPQAQEETAQESS